MGEIGQSDSVDPQARGYELEDRLECRFRDEGFLVRRNSKVAKPRQTDLLARRQEEYYLIEAKYESRKIDISDIDSLRMRLKRTTPYVVGCLFSMSGFTDSAIKEVITHRKRPILLFDAYETSCVLQGKSVTALLRRKKRALITDAEVSFSQPRSQLLQESDLGFPSPDEWIIQSGKRLDLLGFRVHWAGDHVFTSSLPDLAWDTLPGMASATLLNLSCETLPEVAQVLKTVQELFGFSSEGTFSIRQSGYIWQGFGLDTFLRCAQDLDARYSSVELPYIHHSEELVFFDKLVYGFLTLTARQHVDQKFLRDVELEIRLPGTPIDLRPYRELAEATGHTHSYFRHLEETGYESRRLNTDRVFVKPVAEIHRSNRGTEPLVTGLVVKNPFFVSSEDSKRSKKKNREDLPSRYFSEPLDTFSPLHHLTKCEYLICRLQDWHDVGDVPDHYYLTRLEATWTANAVAMRPFCTWGTMTKRVR